MHINKDFNHSYWETKHLFKHYDVIIIGAGIVGLSSAISIKQKYQKSKVLVLERGLQASGASTKNAGFACFGSVGEILDDLNNIEEAVVWQTIQMRWNGLKLLRKRLGDKHMDYQANGGYEIFDHQSDFETSFDNVDYLNKNFKQNLGLQNCFQVHKKNSFGFKNVIGKIYNKFEGQIDTGLMMDNLYLMALKLGVKIVCNCELKNFSQLNKGVQIETNQGEFNTDKLIIATNGFTKQFIKNIDVQPARAQVLITNPIKNLKIKGCFHFDKGYYYFRNIDNRILLGGGRHLDFKKETTDVFGLNDKIQAKLTELLKTIILPSTPFQIEQRWTGIMGLGKDKKPIIQHNSKDVILAIRMGGMGIAIGTWVGEEVASLI